MIRAAALAALLAGCTAIKVPVPAAGSRADGMVDFSYEHGPFEVPKVDEAATRVAAAGRCRAWGYDDADPFNSMSKCEVPGGWAGCSVFRVTMRYQCTGRPEATGMSAPSPTTTPSTAAPSAAAPRASGDSPSLFDRVEVGLPIKEEATRIPPPTSWNLTSEGTLVQHYKGVGRLIFRVTGDKDDPAHLVAIERDPTEPGK
jgi:hypothetical protein